MNIPWAIIGDFNALLFQPDRLSNNPITYGDVRNLAECVHDLLLSELNWKGNYYTLSNKQIGDGRVCCRQDRALCNTDWMSKWGHVVLEYDLPSISDHSPMVLSIYDTQRQIKVPFRFFNVWSDQNEFIPIFTVLAK
ncbi:hypothetical protein T459_19063 [Capsicum annuum]|uniref:Endonuclease/exonuclease/phosphatase domain-containing protein n=1 Tax=Capsicum annuum TaxID=4072 RepID=A0A2G2Z0W6_CAPAN|nr:hypothetical protein T459_19063 [Capsicum annuum]